jgi:hypothetical protein
MGATLLLALLAASGAYGEVSFKDKMALHPPAARAAALAEIMHDRLGLTPEQMSAIRNVAEKHASETDEALGQLKRKKLRKRLKAIREARDADFKNILSEEQFEAYLNDRREIMLAMKARMKGGERPHASSPPASAPDHGR